MTKNKKQKARRTAKQEMEKSFEEQCPQGGIIYDAQVWMKHPCVYCEGCEYDWLPKHLQEFFDNKGVIIR